MSSIEQIYNLKLASNCNRLNEQNLSSLKLTPYLKKRPRLQFSVASNTVCDLNMMMRGFLSFPDLFGSNDCGVPC